MGAVGAGQRSRPAGSRGEIPVLWLRIIEDQRRLRIGELVVPPDRDGGDQGWAGGGPRSGRRVAAARSGRVRTREAGAGRGPPIGPGYQCRVRGSLRSCLGFHRRTARPLGEVLEGAERRVIAPHRVEVVAPGPAEQGDRRGRHCDQGHDGQGDPHPDYSTRRSGRPGSEPPGSGLGARRPGPRRWLSGHHAGRYHRDQGRHTAVTEVRPPSMVRWVPVTNDDSSERRNRMGRAISSGVETRCSGVRSSSC